MSPNSFHQQIEKVRGDIKHFLYLKGLKQTVGPIKELLIKMENIIGNECYNGNIQNYESWGVLDSVGRTFRYPVVFDIDDIEHKRRMVSTDLSEDVLVTGHYKFGANELAIFHALIKIVKMLEQDYDFKLVRGK